MADCWAGAGSMAGGEPLRNTPPENMRNSAFRADIGEKDTIPADLRTPAPRTPLIRGDEMRRFP